LYSRFNMITCISVLEHITEPEKAFQSMIELLRPGGHLVLTMPYNETRYVEDVYKLPNYTGDPQSYPCASYNRAVLSEWLSSSRAKIVKQYYWRMWAGDVWRQHERLPKPERTSAAEPHQLTCLLIQKLS
jgi:2-polyprenyl-3-methyl-5-hydroxy-6-metoxy-1,4-benzoquinol methylase